jgi:hypothetical protein
MLNVALGQVEPVAKNLLSGQKLSCRDVNHD